MHPNTYYYSPQSKKGTNNPSSDRIILVEGLKKIRKVIKVAQALSKATERVKTFFQYFLGPSISQKNKSLIVQLLIFVERLVK